LVIQVAASDVGDPIPDDFIWDRVVNQVGHSHRNTVFARVADGTESNQTLSLIPQGASRVQMSLLHLRGVTLGTPQLIEQIRDFDLVSAPGAVGALYFVNSYTNQAANFVASANADDIVLLGQGQADLSSGSYKTTWATAWTPFGGVAVADELSSARIEFPTFSGRRSYARIPLIAPSEGGGISLASLDDVNVSNPGDGEELTFDGTNWTGS
jgi:hypothetical protein